MPCSNCKEKELVYCVDCKKSYCRFCAVLLHHPDTKPENHSIEEIAKYGGVKVITPILLDVLLFAVAIFLMNGSGISEDYFVGMSYCPALSRGRKWLVNFDANFFFYYKAHLAKYCDWEDSYWRFFVDTWVRGILTGSDSWLLLASEFIKAYLIEEFFRVLISPIIAYTYALVASLARFVEYEIFEMIYAEEGETHRLTHIFEGVEKVVTRLSLAQKLALPDKNKPPPPTLRRKRPMTDYVENAKYWYNRHTRLIMHYKAQAQTACSFVLHGSMKVAAVIRVACLLFGNTSFLAVVQLLGFGDLAAQHQSWFTSSTGIDLHERNTYVSDWLVGLGIQQAFKQVPIARDITQDLVLEAMRGVTGLVPLAQKIIIPAALILAPYVMFKMTIKRQKKSFDAKWKSQYKKELWGDISRKNPCGGNAWTELTFSPNMPNGGKK